ncbi:putative periplasmic serine endoprotease DegP-like [Candidatus Sulfobium mesophilum]|uniref:Putative periplasmic serine endoprotease DegP-like n=1 Tax=Candidatus Sulfobium mesophilum TaxID=2016548 RepID=A0A2U3QG20_9BACT|nr:putative periplasmic serine endoprotease DegP-like [Candidatus Sulfobium mesophilum]
MERGRGGLVIAVASTVVGIIIGLVISTNSALLSKAYSAEPKIPKEAVEILSKTGQAMAEVAAAVKPAVVNISTTHTVKTPGMSNPFFNDPFFNRFFGEEFGNMRRPREYKQSSLGSGVIVDKDGYILTNYHVIKDADEIKVKLSDNREFKGKVIGKDARTDIAVIKIGSDHLPTLSIGDSDKLKVGEVVIAIGNPFGLNQTVTSGIVSATGRANVGIADYEDFIQTDAAINPGNSGGALVNVKGELVGINTAIFSTSGGYQGVGFAIPSAMVKTVMDNLIKHGKVVRGWLGVSIQQITPELAKQFNLKEQKGVLVGDVTEDSPAERAGIKRGDVIIGYNGKDVEDPANLRNMVANTPPGKEVVLRVVHDGKAETVKVTVAELPAETQKLQGKIDNVLKGIQVQNITQDLRRNLRLPKQVTGVIITDVEEGSPAGGILSRNDVIMEINRKSVSNLGDFEKVVSGIRSDQNMLLLIYRDGSTFYVTISGQ